MAKKMLIDATHAEETRVVVVDGVKVEEFDFETLNKRQLAGNIYLAKVTRVEPSLQAAFVDYGGNRHGFLAFAEIHPDYYQIPAADRQALIEEDRAAQEAAEAEENARDRKSRNRRRPAAEKAVADAVAQSEPLDGEAAEALADAPSSDDIPGMAVRDLAEEAEAEAQDHAAPETRVAGTDEDDTDDHPADEIESVAEEDVTEEVRPARKPRARRYKIQEVIKVRQIMLVQVVKEERGNKGAALTTYLSLAGRYCVLMPNTARGGGISRKITNAADRKKLKEIAGELEVPQGAGLIIRTAGSQRTKTEIKRDYEYLMRLWEQIREVTFKSIAPAPIYEEGDLIKRTIRDLYSKDIDEVWVEGERGYRTAKDFMKMIMPTHAGAVKRYTDSMPLFARYQVEGYLAGMFNPVVQLKSGGYIVIGVTEALVAIDVNSGRATKEGSIEETAFKTNCEAADEIARQLRLRDLAGLIVIDFIDMDERKNNAAVEKRFKDKLKTDRARIQVGRISGFGLMEMSRQRLRPGMLESTTQPCPHCHGTGLIRSDDSMALTILRAIEEEGTRKRSREVLVKAPVAVVNFLMNQKREHIGMIETRYGMAVRVEADPSLISPDFAVEKFKTATRNVPSAQAPVLTVDASLMAQIDDEEELFDLPEDEADETEAEAPRNSRDDDEPRAEAAEGDEQGKSRRRRRRRRRGGRNGEEGDESAADAGDAGADEAAEAAAAGDAPQADVGADAAPEGEAEKPKRIRSRSRSRGRRKDTDAATDDAAQDTIVPLADVGAPLVMEATPIEAGAADIKAAAPETEAEPVAEAVALPVGPDSADESGAEAPAEADAQDAAPAEDQDAAAEAESPAEAEDAPVEAEGQVDPAPEDAAAEVPANPALDAAAAEAPEAGESRESEAQTPAAAPAPEADAPAGSRRRGWWSAGR